MTNFFRQHKLILMIAVAVVAAVVIACFCITDSSENTKERLSKYSEEFFEEYNENGAASDSVQGAILAEALANMDNDSLFYGGMRKFGRRMFEKGEQMMAFEYLKQVMSILDEDASPSEDMLRYKAHCYLLLGAATDEVGLTALSQGYYFSGMKVADEAGDLGVKNDFYNNIGVSMYRTGNAEKAEKFYNLALQGAKTQNNSSLYFIVYNNLAEVHAGYDDFPMAIDYMLKAIQSVDVSTHPDDYYSLQTALGNLYLRNGDYPMAYACLSNAFRNQDSLGNKSFLYDTSLFLADYFREVRNDDSVRKYMGVAWRMADLTHNPGHKITLLNKEAAMQSEFGSFEKAFQIMQKSQQLKDSLHNEENGQRIERAHTIYEIEKKAYEEKSGMANWNPVVVFVTMSFAVLLLAGVAVWVLLVKRRSDRINEEKARTASELVEMRERQLAEEQERKARQDEEMRLFNQKLTSFTLERIKNNERLEEVSMEMKKALINVPPRDKEQQTMLKGIIQKLAMVQSDTQWDEFQYYFEKVHPDFYSRLDKAHPDLTAKDRRLCALLSLGLSTKDIASIISLEVRSVESSRNRLRKKLGLENDQNLFDYIRSVSLKNTDN